MKNSTVDALGLAAAFAALIWILSLCHCSPDPGPLPPASQPGCVGACARGAELQCDWADDGCKSFCDAYHGVGYMRPWADCVGRAGNPDAVRACGMSCEVER